MPAPIPLSQPDITQREIDAVVDVLSTNTLSIGPKVVEFEKTVAKLTGRQHGIAVSSGTAGLHCAMLAAGIKPGDEVITTPFSFVASANCILYVDAKPVFVDIEPQTLNIDVEQDRRPPSPARHARIVAVEAFGHPGGMVELEQIAQKNELILIEDSCEGFGGFAGQRRHRHLRPRQRLRLLSQQADHHRRRRHDRHRRRQLRRHVAARSATRAAKEWTGWRTQRLGYNYRLSEIAAALGIAQCRTARRNSRRPPARGPRTTSIG